MGNEDEEARFSEEKANYTTIGVKAGDILDITHNGTKMSDKRAHALLVAFS